MRLSIFIIIRLLAWNSVDGLRFSFAERYPSESDLHSSVRWVSRCEGLFLDCRNPMVHLSLQQHQDRPMEAQLFALRRLGSNPIGEEPPS